MMNICTQESTIEVIGVNTKGCREEDLRLSVSYRKITLELQNPISVQIEDLIKDLHTTGIAIVEQTPKGIYICSKNDNNNY